MDKNQLVNNTIEYIKDKIAPEKIYLFGSYAKGTARPDSDLDFLIIKNTSAPKRERTLPLYALDKTKKIGAVIGVDFIVYTPEEFKTLCLERNSLASEVIKTGKLVYDKQANT